MFSRRCVPSVNETRGVSVPGTPRLAVRESTVQPLQRQPSAHERALMPVASRIAKTGSRRPRIAGLDRLTSARPKTTGAAERLDARRPTNRGGSKTGWHLSTNLSAVQGQFGGHLG